MESVREDARIKQISRSRSSPILPPMRPGNVKQHRQHRHYKQPHHRRLFRSLIARALPLRIIYTYIYRDKSKRFSPSRYTLLASAFASRPSDRRLPKLMQIHLRRANLERLRRLPHVSRRDIPSHRYVRSISGSLALSRNETR